MCRLSWTFGFWHLLYTSTSKVSNVGVSDHLLQCLGAYRHGGVGGGGEGGNESSGGDHQQPAVVVSDVLASSDGSAYSSLQASSASAPEEDSPSCTASMNAKACGGIFRYSVKVVAGAGGSSGGGCSTRSTFTPCPLDVALLKQAQLAPPCLSQH